MLGAPGAHEPPKAGKERRTSLDSLTPYGYTLYRRPLQYRTNGNLFVTLLRNGLLPYKVKFLDV